jgi:hypothetical protein
VAERTAEAAPLSPFVEPLPERIPAPALPVQTEGTEGFAAVRSAAFMTHEEKLALRDNRLLDLEPEPAPAAKPDKEPLSPEAAARRKLILRGAFAAAVAATAYVTREAWLPAPLKLELTESNNHVTALWNAEILDPAATGVLIVNDGGESTATKLSPSKLAGGVFGFDRKTSNVTATLQVDGKSVTATLQTANR